MTSTLYGLFTQTRSSDIRANPYWDDRTVAYLLRDNATGAHRWLLSAGRFLDAPVGSHHQFQAGDRTRGSVTILGIVDATTREGDLRPVARKAHAVWVAK